MKNIFFGLMVVLVMLSMAFAIVQPAVAQACDPVKDPTCLPTSPADQSKSFDWGIVTAVVNLIVALFLFGTGQQQATEVAKELLRRALAKLRGLWPLGVAFPEGAKSALLALLVAWLVMNKVDVNLFKDFDFFKQLGVTDPKILEAMGTVATWIASMFVKNSPIASYLFDATSTEKLDKPQLTWSTLIPRKK